METDGQNSLFVFLKILEVFYSSLEVFIDRIVVETINIL